jgi:hypothetical protein
MEFRPKCRDVLSPIVLTSLNAGRIGDGCTCHDSTPDRMSSDYCAASPTGRAAETAIILILFKPTTSDVTPSTYGSVEVSSKRVRTSFSRRDEVSPNKSSFLPEWCTDCFKKWKALYGADDKWDAAQSNRLLVTGGFIAHALGRCHPPVPPDS